MPSPPALEELQLGLRDVFTDPRGARAAAAANPRTLSWIRDARPCDAATRLSVYGDGYFLRLLESLSFDFPAVRRLAGEKSFRRLAAHYLERHPSTSPSLADLGEAFPTFTGAHELARRWPFLPDLAGLERAVSECLLVDRRPPLRAEKLAELGEADWAAARLVLDPTVRLLRTRWPVLALWRGGKRPARARRQDVLVARRERGVSVRVLAKPEWETLRRLRDGEPLGEALSKSRQPARVVRGWFSRWTSGGLIKDVRTSPTVQI